MCSVILNGFELQISMTFSSKKSTELLNNYEKPNTYLISRNKVHKINLNLPQLHQRHPRCFAFKNFMFSLNFLSSSFPDLFSQT